MAASVEKHLAIEDCFEARLPWSRSQAARSVGQASRTKSVVGRIPYSAFSAVTGRLMGAVKIPLITSNRIMTQWLHLPVSQQGRVAQGLASAFAAG